MEVLSIIYLSVLVVIIVSACIGWCIRRCQRRNLPYQEL